MIFYYYLLNSNFLVLLLFLIFLIALKRLIYVSCGYDALEKDTK